MLRGRANLVSQVFEAIVTIKSTGIHMVKKASDQSINTGHFICLGDSHKGTEKEDTAGAAVFSK